jgi:hypothetical protein
MVPGTKHFNEVRAMIKLTLASQRKYVNLLEIICMIGREHYVPNTLTPVVSQNKNVLDSKLNIEKKCVERHA